MSTENPPSSAADSADAREVEDASRASEAFEDLVAESLERFDRGGLAAVEDLLRHHPKRADSVRAALLRLHGSGLLNKNQEDEFPSSLGEFRLLRRIGGGGMGVVFLARQESLERDVALKIVRPDYLYFDNAKKRFHREVLAVSRLQHPGIVPVWHVGEENGLPYFAMEYVMGCSLGEVLARARDRQRESSRPLDRRGHVFRELVQGDESLSGSHDSHSGSKLFEGSWEQVCLRITLRIAEALCHAHDLHIVHRDVKPSNVMITADGQVKLVDFGLATLESSEKITKSNAMMGSLNYMSPEQVRREQVDDRTDVYSLGVTLFELLCLETPFDDNDPAKLREDILKSAPRSLRQRIRSISRDTETVCERAMAGSLGHRYPSMIALADDLRNLLELRPIHARPPSVVRRTTRWVQRNAMLTMALLMMFVVAVSSTSLWWQQWLATEQLRIEKERGDVHLEESIAANAKLEVAKTRAEKHLDSARKAIDTMLTRIANSELAIMPRASELRKRVLQDAYNLYEELVATNADTRLQVDLAKLENRIGYLQQQIGDYKDAETLFGQAIDRLRDVAEREPSPGHAIDLGEALTFRAGLRMLQRKGDEAFEAVREAILLMEPAIEQGDPKPGEALLASRVARLAHTYTQMGNIYARFPKVRPESGSFDRDFERAAIELWERVLREWPKHPNAKQNLADACRRLGSSYTRRRKFDEGIALLRRSVEIFRPLYEAKSLTAIDRSNYGLAHGSIATAYSASGRRAEAKSWHEKEIEIHRALVDDHPTYPAFSSSLGGGLNNLAMLQFEDQELQAADENIHAAIRAQKNAIARLRRGVFLSYMRNHLYTLCRLHYRLGRLEELIRDGKRLPEFDQVRGRGEIDAASWMMHAALGFRKTDPTRVEKCRTDALGLLETSRKKGFLKPQYLGADIFTPLIGRPRFEALRK